MPKERPILFSSAMVRALLSGAKHQTRRLVKHPNVVDIDAWADAGGGLWEMGVHEAGSTAGMGKLRCPYGAPGDRLWVRETWAPFDGDTNRNAAPAGFPAMYRADRSFMVEPSLWKPSIHMPRWASRIDLEVTAVRVERLQAITEEDAKAEGADLLTASQALWKGSASQDGCARAGYPDAPRNTGDWTPRDCFRLLWGAINGPESWALNPWVWVVEFRRVRP